MLRSHEEVELTFYNPERNGSMIALSNIPVLVQGQVVPMNFGSVQIPLETNKQPLYRAPDADTVTYPLHNALLSISNLNQPITEEI